MWVGRERSRSLRRAVLRTLAPALATWSTEALRKSLGSAAPWGPRSANRGAQRSRAGGRRGTLLAQEPGVPNGKSYDLAFSREKVVRPGGFEPLTFCSGEGNAAPRFERRIAENSGESRNPGRSAPGPERNPAESRGIQRAARRGTSWHRRVEKVVRAVRGDGHAGQSEPAPRSLFDQQTEGADGPPRRSADPWRAHRASQTQTPLAGASRSTRRDPLRNLSRAVQNHHARPQAGSVGLLSSGSPSRSMRA
jgi:hypothetical protein